IGLADYTRTYMIRRTLKPVIWAGSSREDLRALPSAAQDFLGHDLHRLQIGLMPADYKPMRSIGSGVFEIRAHVGSEHRLIYVAKYAEAIYVLHAFEKKAQKTPQRDIELARRRLAAVEWQRQNPRS